MKKYVIILLAILIAFSSVLAACAPDVNEIVGAVNATLTSIPTATIAPAELFANEDEVNQLEIDLTNAYVELTVAAEQIATLESQANDQTRTIVITATPEPTKDLPTATPTVPQIPDDQMVVYIKVSKATLWKVSSKNKKGYPIMVKTSPVISFNQGAWLLVYRAVVYADGGGTYYRTITPAGGYYVHTQDVSPEK